MKIFGREPVFVLAFVAITLKLASAYGLDVSAEQQGAIMAVLSVAVGVVNAVVLKTGAVAGLLVNLGQAVVALFLAFGVEMSADTLALWGLLIEAAVALLLRPQVEPPVGQVRMETRSAVKEA